MEFEREDELEQELRDALARRPAPAGLKARVMARRAAGRRRRGIRQLWKIAATLLIAATAAGGSWAWREHRERERGEEARRQLMLALRITGHALDQVQVNLERGLEER